jgi:hypothetical protein
MNEKSTQYLCHIGNLLHLLQSFPVGDQVLNERLDQFIIIERVNILRDVIVGNRRDLPQTVHHRLTNPLIQVLESVDLGPIQVFVDVHDSVNDGMN